MLGLGERGVAAVTVVIIAVAGVVAGVATPVVVDLADVDPDHPLYGLERLGERIRMVDDFGQMKDRFGEALRMCEKGKGLYYRGIIEEFLEKMKALAPEQFEAEAHVIAWMQEHMPSIGKIKLLLLKEAAEHLKHGAPPDVLEGAENCLKELEESELWPPENLDDILARLELIKGQLENLHQRHPGPRGEVEIDIDVYISVRENVDVVYPRILVPKENLEEVYHELLERFDNKYDELMSLLETMPKDTHGARAAKVLAERAKVLGDSAVAAKNQGRLREAVGRLIAANRLIDIAEKIVEHIHEWEEEHAALIEAWKELFEEKLGKWKNLREGWKERRSVPWEKGLY